MAAKAAPLLLQSSKDTGDTRPDTSGAVPSTHFNVPLYQHVPTQSPDPVMGGFLNVLSGGAYAHPESEGPYWKGVAQSFNPTTLSGAANLASNLFPGNLHSGSVPMELPSSVPGVRIVRARSGDTTISHTGWPFRLEKMPSEYSKNTAVVGYNAVDSNGDIVGSVSGILYPHQTYIDQLHVNDEYRSTPLFRDLLHPVIARGKPVGGVVVNDRLAGIMKRLQKRQGVSKHSPVMLGE